MTDKLKWMPEFHDRLARAHHMRFAGEPLDRLSREDMLVALVTLSELWFADDREDR